MKNIFDVVQADVLSANMPNLEADVAAAEMIALVMPKDAVYGRNPFEILTASLDQLIYSGAGFGKFGGKILLAFPGFENDPPLWQIPEVCGLCKRILNDRPDFVLAMVDEDHPLLASIESNDHIRWGSYSGRLSVVAIAHPEVWKSTPNGWERDRAANKSILQSVLSTARKNLS